MKPSPRPTVEGSEVELLRRIAAGDSAALGLAFDRFYDSVYGFLARSQKRHGDLDDLVQMTFLALPAAAVEYDGRGSVRGFILGVAWRTARRERRRIFRRFALWQVHGEGLDEPVTQVDPEQHAAQRQEMRRFEQALAALSEAHRDTFLLVQVEGLKGEEVASILGVPVNTVWTRLHHARNALRDAMREGGAR